MAVQLNHTIVSARDKWGSAKFYADVLGVEQPTTFGAFVVVTLDNGISLDFLENYGLDEKGNVHSQHYAFLVTEPEFDEILGRIQTRGLSYWADPSQSQLGEINSNDGGRGVYWEDPDGHILEIITRPYGG